MPKYLFESSFTNEGVKGLLREGGSGRTGAVEQTVASLGGRLEAFYFGFGETDTYVIADLPDNASAAALALSVTASGAVVTKTTVLITPEEMDAATKKTVAYRAPGA
ncbi:MAG: GYD domain-containing protein [Chloroflexi bacterium]|nr:GYD domain-containing protein [Chloroflexota bacterium]